MCIRSLVHCAGLMVHEIRCSSVCYSQFPSSLPKLHFTMLGLVFVTPTLNLLMVFHSNHDKIPPNRSCCVGWIGSSAWSSSCYLCSLNFYGGSCSFLAVYKKLLRDLSLVIMISCLNLSIHHVGVFVLNFFGFFYVGGYAFSNFKWRYNL